MTVEGSASSEAQELGAEVARLRAELDATRQERDAFRRLFDQAPAYIAFTSGPDHVYAYSNPLNTTLLGGRDVLGKRVPEAVPELADHPLMGILDRCYATGEPHHVRDMPAAVVEPDGAVRELVLDGVILPIRDAAGEVSGLLTHSVEVSERTRELARQKRLIEGIVDHSPAGLAYIDRSMRVRWINDAYLAFVDRQREEYLDRHLFEEVSPASRERYEPLLRSVLDEGATHHIENLAYTPPTKGSVRYCDFAYVPIYGPDGAVEGALAIALDVTARAERERLQRDQIDQLRQLDRLKDEFLSNLSHELRTPINAIMGFASILADDVAGPLTPGQRHGAERILEGADVLLALIDDLLDMTRIQAGKFSLEMTRVPVPALVASVLGGLAPLAAQRGHRLEVQLAPDLPAPEADATRLGQVLRNLVSNAIKFSPDGATVVVRAAAAGGRLRVEVADDGEGIAPADQARLFQRFSQLDPGPTRRVGGLGLGLSIVKALVEAHGGEVGVASQPGAGATFWFDLPL